MIYDPFDVNMCMNERGVLFYRRPQETDPTQQWAELNELRRTGEFRRPEW